MAYEDQWYLFLTMLVVHVLVATYSIWIILVTPPLTHPIKKNPLKKGLSSQEYYTLKDRWN